LETAQKCIIAQTAPHKVTELPSYKGINISEFSGLKELFIVLCGESGDEKSKEVGEEKGAKQSLGLE